MPKFKPGMYFRSLMAPENLAGRTVARYQLLERVGEGGTATVYRAEHPDRGVCAVKILRQQSRNDPTAVKRFLREAEFGGRVAHNHVVCTFEYGEQDGLYFLALEWASGQVLTQYAKRAVPMAPAAVASIVTQLAGALGAAHAAGIIHRDLKPDNIVIDPASGLVKLLDFGIARDAEDNPAERLTRTGFFVGSLNYVAPEALSGALVDERADIFSLATIAYFLLSCRHPFDGKNPRELFQQLLTNEPRPLNQAGGPNVSKALEQVVMKGLARDPAQRYQRVEEFGRDFAAAAAGTAAAVEGGGLLGRIRRLFGRG